MCPQQLSPPTERPENGGGSNGGYYPPGSGVEPREQCYNDTVHALASLAAQYPQITFHLHVGANGHGAPNSIQTGIDFLLQAGSLPNMMLGLRMGILQAQGVTAGSLTAVKSKVGMLFAAAIAFDPWNGSDGTVTQAQMLNDKAPLSTMSDADAKAYAAYLQAVQSDTWVVVDAFLPDLADGINAQEDAEYREFNALRKLL